MKNIIFCALLVFSSLLYVVNIGSMQKEQDFCQVLDNLKIRFITKGNQTIDYNASPNIQALSGLFSSLAEIHGVNQNADIQDADIQDNDTIVTTILSDFPKIMINNFFDLMGTVADTELTLRGKYLQDFVNNKKSFFIKGRFVAIADALNSEMLVKGIFSAMSQNIIEDTCRKYYKIKRNDARKKMVFEELNSKIDSFVNGLLLDNLKYEFRNAFYNACKPLLEAIVHKKSGVDDYPLEITEEQIRQKHKIITPQVQVSINKINAYKQKHDQIICADEDVVSSLKNCSIAQIMFILMNFDYNPFRQELSPTQEEQSPRSIAHSLPDSVKQLLYNHDKTNNYKGIYPIGY